MTPEQWRQVKELLADALEMDAPRREAFVVALCERDPRAGHEVERLLAGHESSDGFLEATGDRGFDALTEPVPGQRIGGYEILREIGTDGMGTVYLAEHAGERDRKQVAIKVMHAQPGMSEVARRFRLERRVLAALRHPNIAPLLDGGTTVDGRPYLVMEYLRGETMNVWCESHQPDLRARVSLIRQICEAVAYAHEHDVIHRDIKPGNILVAEDGTPWLLDFGIAKVLGPGLGVETAVSALGQAPMTPEYASPEQIRRGPVGPASDIYSLAVVQRELLRPCGAIPRELEAVLRKATAYEPDERYSSMAEFSEDLERFLKNVPVRALAASPFYRARKFLKRHRAAALSSAAASLLVLLAVGLEKPLRSPGARLGELHFTYERIASLGDPAPGGGSFVNDFEPYGRMDAEILRLPPISPLVVRGCFCSTKAGIRS
jgi:predicted Ser/Thr protein kinase